MIAWWLLGLALGATDASLGSCPGDPAQTAVRRFEEMLVTGSPEAEVGFADCLSQLELAHSAQRHYLEVIRMDVRGPAWIAAVDRSMALVDVLGDPHSVMPYIHPLDPRRIPVTRGKDALYYVHAQGLIADGRYELAAVRLEEVSPGSRWRGAAVLAQARSLELEGRLRPALDLYGQVESAAERPDARARMLMLLSRQGAVDEALAVAEELTSVPRWRGFALAMRARLLLDAGRLDEAEGAAQDALRAAKLGTYLPEAELVAAEVAVGACKVGRARRHLNRFERTWTPVRMALDAAVNVGSVDGLRLYEAWLGDAPVDWGLPHAVRDAALDARPVRGWLDGHLAQIAAEQARVDGIGGADFQTIVAPHLHQVLDDGRERLHYLLGQAVGQRLRDMHRELQVHERAAQALQARVADCAE